MASRLTLLLTGWFLTIVHLSVVAQSEKEPSAGTRLLSSREPADPAGESADPRNVIDLMRNVDQLLDRLEASDALSPDDPEIKQVEKYIDDITNLEPTSSYLAFYRGRWLALTGRDGDAMVQLRQFVETRQGQTEWRAFRLLGDLFLDEYPRVARSNYRKAAALNPAEASLLFGLSVTAMKLGAIDASVSFARDAVNADDGQTVRYVVHLASALAANGDLDEALRVAESALQLAQEGVASSPGAREPLLVLEAQYRFLTSILRSRISNRTTEGVNDFLRLETCVKQHIQVSGKLALHELLRVMETGVESSEPKAHPELLYRYGLLLSDVGRIEEAIAVLDRVAKLDPDNLHAAEALGRLRKLAGEEAR